jgi:L-alanine-DL-glutamate epimerase-like enolase superfamily enzyme
MLQTLSCAAERRRLKAPFRISRGVKTEIEAVVATIDRDGVTGRGEGIPYARYQEDSRSVIDQIESVRSQVRAGLDRRGLMGLLPPGAARNALDCALWDLEARLAGTTVSALLGRPRPGSCVTAMTISLDAPGRMGEAAAELAAAPLLKIKVDGLDPEAQIAAVRAAAPAARLIVDPNEGWSLDLLKALQPFLRAARVDLVEQPLPSDADEGLEALSPLVPICADESFHSGADIERVSGRYQCINIKLDKSGGLTHALELQAMARARGLSVMIGCMVCTSLSIAPALLLAQGADFVDLDGPLWLASDHPDGVGGQGGVLTVSGDTLWHL